MYKISSFFAVESNERNVPDFKSGPWPVIEFEENDRITLNDPHENLSRKFNFSQNSFFPPESKSDDIWKNIKNDVEKVMDGFNVMVFCYGETVRCVVFSPCFVAFLCDL